MSARFEQPAEGILRLGSRQINWYLVADDDGVTVVDAGAPAYRPQLEPGLAQLGRTIDDVRAVVLTHGDADHKGFAEKLRAERGTPVYVHSGDAAFTRGEASRPHERGFLPYLRYPAAWKALVTFIRGGRPQAVQEVRTFEDGEVLEVPGRPRVIHTPGHSAGSVVLHFERHGALFVGDVLFLHNIITGRGGPQISPAVFNTSTDQAMSALSRIEDVEVDVVLAGHGDPWRGGVRAAVAAARAAGPS